MYIIVAVDIVILLILILSFIAYKKVFGERCDKYIAPPSGIDTPWLEYADRARAGQKWMKEHITSEHEIISYDGLKLRGFYIANPENRGTVMLVHGYHSNGFRDYGATAKDTYSKGFNLFVISQRAHYESEGKTITFGIKERYDVVAWANYLKEVVDIKKPVFLYGVSMGASTVMMSMAEALPDYVVGVMADCGYDSVRREIQYVMKKSYHLPAFPVLYTVEALFCIFNGCSMRYPDLNETLKNAKLPLFIAHGTADTFVPVTMSERNYANCGSECKRFVEIEGAGHGVSYLVDTERYNKALDEFIEYCENKSEVSAEK